MYSGRKRGRERGKEERHKWRKKESKEGKEGGRKRLQERKMDWGWSEERGGIWEGGGDLLAREWPGISETPKLSL